MTDLPNEIVEGNRCTCSLDWNSHCPIHGTESDYYKKWMEEVGTDRRR
jgi:hypothetical protein